MKNRTGLIDKNKKPRTDNLTHKLQEDNFSQSSYSPCDRVLYLQKIVGNHAVQRVTLSGIIQAKLKNSSFTGLQTTNTHIENKITENCKDGKLLPDESRTFYESQ